MSKIEELQKNSHTHDRVVNAIVEDIADLDTRHMTNSARIDNVVGWSCEHLQRLDQLDEDISVISNENAQLKKDYSNVVDAFISFAYRLDTDMMAIREEVRELKERLDEMEDAFVSLAHRLDRKNESIVQNLKSVYNLYHDQFDIINQMEKRTESGRCNNLDRIAKLMKELRELKELESNHFRWCDWSIKAITDVIVKMKKKRWWQLWK